MPPDPLFQPKMQAEGMYGYDIDLADALHRLQQQRQAGLAQPVFGAGGLQGAGLQRRIDMEGTFLAAVEQAKRRRMLAEMQRKTQEADIANRRRAQAMGAIGGGIAQTANSWGGALGGLAQSPLREPRRVLGEGGAR